MNFSQWLKAQSSREDAIGQLARDVKKDDMWPNEAKTFNIVYNYLMSQGVHMDTLKILLDAWHEYPGRERTGPND